VSFWLAHHRSDQLERTYAVGKVHLCARCVATYPVLFAGMAVLFALRAPLTWRFDVPFALLLTLPALADWAVGQFRPQGGSNLRRSLTGALLGVALARTLYVHVQRPLPPALVAQLALALLVAMPILVFASWRAR
jgi:uncharacterized membrane protein